MKRTGVTDTTLQNGAIADRSSLQALESAAMHAKAFVPEIFWRMFIILVRPIYEWYCHLTKVPMQAWIDVLSLSKSFFQEASGICTGPIHWLRKWFDCRRFKHKVRGIFFARDVYVQNFTSKSAVCVLEQWAFSRSAIGNGRKILNQKSSCGNRLERKEKTVLWTTNGYWITLTTTLYRVIGCAKIERSSSAKFWLSLGNDSGILRRSIKEQWMKHFLTSSNIWYVGSKIS